MEKNTHKGDLLKSVSSGKTTSTVPEIRTMQDDLANIRASKDSRTTHVRNGSSATPPVQPSSDKQKASRSVPLPPKSITSPLPKTPVRSKRRRVRTVTLVMIFIILFSVVMGGGAFVYWLSMRDARVTGTVVDYIPENAEFVVSGTKEASRISSRIVTAAADALETSEDVFGSGWESITYTILPGGTPAEPVVFIVVRGGKEVAEQDGLKVVAMDDATWGVMRATNAGRVNLTGKMLASNKTIHAGLGDVEISDGFLYVSEAGIRRLNAVLVDVGAPVDMNATVFTLQEGDPSIMGKGVDAPEIKLLLSGGLGAKEEIPVHSGVFTGDVVHDITAWMDTLNRNPNAEEFVRTLSEESISNAYEVLLDSITGSAITGVRASTGVAEKESIAVIALEEGSSDRVRDALSVLEPAFVALGPVLTGRAGHAEGFMEYEHEGIPIRFVNFPTPDRAVDYALVGDVLLLTTSRDSMFDLIHSIVHSEDSDIWANEEEIRDAIRRVAPEGKSWVWFADFGSPLFLRLPSSWSGILQVFENVVLESR